MNKPRNPYRNRDAVSLQARRWLRWLSGGFEDLDAAYKARMDSEAERDAYDPLGRWMASATDERCR